MVKYFWRHSCGWIVIVRGVGLEIFNREDRFTPVSEEEQERWCSVPWRKVPKSVRSKAGQRYAAYCRNLNRSQ